MTRRLSLGALLAGCLLLAGCSGAPSPAGSDSPSGPAPEPAGTSATPTPTSTLSAEQQQAVDEAAEVVLAYQQLLIDLQADPEPYLNEMNAVAAQPQLKRDLLSLQDIVGGGETVIETTGPIKIASVEPLKVSLLSDPPTVTLLVCVDSSAVSGSYRGKPLAGERQSLLHRLVKTTYLPDPGWAVAEVLPPDGHDQPQPC